jgi:hypothetical protein
MAIPLYLAVAGLVDTADPLACLEFETREVSVPLSVPPKESCARYEKREWNAVRGMWKTGLGCRRLTLFRLRLEKYVPLWLIGLDLGREPDEKVF